MGREIISEFIEEDIKPHIKKERDFFIIFMVFYKSFNFGRNSKAGLYCTILQSTALYCTVKYCTVPWYK